MKKYVKKRKYICVISLVSLGTMISCFDYVKAGHIGLEKNALNNVYTKRDDCYGFVLKSPFNKIEEFPINPTYSSISLDNNKFTEDKTTIKIYNYIDYEENRNLLVSVDISFKYNINKDDTDMFRVYTNGMSEESIKSNVAFSIEKCINKVTSNYYLKELSDVEGNRILKNIEEYVKDKSSEYGLTINDLKFTTFRVEPSKMINNY